MSNNLELLFLGTCACDFTDRLENEFKDRFDKDERRASSLLINGRYLIDCGMHILDSLRIAGVDASKITDVFITHLHDDHFNAENVGKIAKESATPLKIWVKSGAKALEIDNAEIIYMSPFEKYKISEELTITGMDANHDPEAYPQHFLIEKDNKKLFYGCDGAWLLSNTYNYLRGAELDVAVFDATVGDYNGDYRIAEHNSIPMLRLMLPTLKNEKIITEQTKIFLSHIAPSLHKPHGEILKTANGFGADVAFDGLKMRI